MKIKEVMSQRPVFIREDEFLTKARQLMRDHRFRTLPVVDEKNRVKGVITIQDVLKITSTKSNITVKGFIRPTPVITPEMDLEAAAKAMMEGEITRVPVVESPHTSVLVGMLSIVDIFKAIDLDKLSNLQVKDIMTANVKVCSPDDPISKIWMNMIEFGISGFPVVRKNKLIGIITRSDIVKLGYVRIGKEDERKKLNITPKVEKIMKTPVHTVAPESTVKAAAELMFKYDIGRIPVVRNSKLVGIVDRYDIIRAYMSVVE
ncbi:MAG: CBS domain-containing protein [Methanocellales archaeon]